MARLDPDLELLRMGLTPPEVELLAWRDPLNLLQRPVTRGLLAIALSKGGSYDEFTLRMGTWQSRSMKRSKNKPSKKIQDGQEH